MTGTIVARAPYDEFADYYDRTTPDRSAEVAFYRALVRPSTRSLLDLGCGTGALTIPLAREIALHGDAARIVGLDESARMLEIARRAEPGIRWVQGDMRSPPVAGRFDLVTCGFNTLQLLPSEADLVDTLHSALQLTATDGRFVFDIYQPDLAVLHGSFKVQPVRSFEMDGRRFEIHQDGCYDAASRVLAIDWTLVDCDAQPPRALHTLKHRLRQYFREDLERLLGVSGWAIRERFGSYDFTAFTAASKKQLLVCQRG
jgi:SAM-dependent methyltransferase